MNYKINTTQEKVTEGEDLIRSNGGSIDVESFVVSGVRGNYSFEDGVPYVEIIDKPFLASWGVIESKLKEFFT